MDLEERKKQLILLLRENEIEGSGSPINKSVLEIPNCKIWVLSNFGGQVVLNGSKKMIQTIRSTPIEKILYDGIKVDYFAVPGWSENSMGKKSEDASQWCFISSSKIYNSIQVYRDEESQLWINNPKKDWKANISKKLFYWKSDQDKFKLEIEWENYKDLKPNNTQQEKQDEIVIYESDGIILVEGKLLETLSFKYERNSLARQKCIEHHGAICKICQYDSSKIFTKPKYPIIDVHHIIPISQVGKEYQINPLTDLIPLCPNCHRFVHTRKENPLSITEAIELLKEN